MILLLNVLMKKNKIWRIQNENKIVFGNKCGKIFFQKKNNFFPLNKLRKFIKILINLS